MSIKCMNEQVFKAVSASADHFSSDQVQGCFGKWLPSEEWIGASFQGTLAGADQADAVLKFQICDYPTPSDAHAVDKLNGSLALTGNGEFSLSLPYGAVMERWVRLAYVHGTNSAGTLDGFLTLKG